MGGALIIPREVIQTLAGEPDLLALWVYLADRAAWKPSVAPKGQALEKGQLVTSKAAIRRVFGWTESKTWRGLKRLQERNVIELKANRRGTIVTLCRWELYERLPEGRRTKSEPKPNRNRTETEPASEPKANTSEGRSPSESRGQSPSLWSTSTAETVEVDDDHVEFGKGEWWTPERIGQVRDICNKAIETIRAKCSKHEDRDLLAKAAALTLGPMPEVCFWSAVEGTGKASRRPDKPWAYFKTCCDDECEKRGRKFNQLLAQIEIPECLLNPGKAPKKDRPEPRAKRMCVPEEIPL
ncbi:MAG: hypothetical protein CMJ58_16950 [Planctomycetaceae bacterium]|nr:hypothetical protein [Planctomycetaceae bacterium]